MIEKSTVAHNYQLFTNKSNWELVKTKFNLTDEELQDRVESELQMSAWEDVLDRVTETLEEEGERRMPDTKVVAFIDPKFIDFMKNPDALSMELTVFKHGGHVSRWWRDELQSEALRMTVELPDIQSSTSKTKEEE